MTALERPDPAPVALEPPAPSPTRDARREGKPGQLVPPHELALVDGILVVADARHTDRNNVEAARIQFGQVGGQVVGTVMSNAPALR